jgi:nucleotidyltransferase/DNA polymerase involved in DNA repair
MATDRRRLGDLISVGKAMLRDLEILGVRSVADLAGRSPERLYEKLCRVAPQHQDICCLDVFRAAVAQARDPRLPAEQCQWWYWSQARKDVASRQLRADRNRREEVQSADEGGNADTKV